MIITELERNEVITTRTFEMENSDPISIDEKTVTTKIEYTFPDGVKKIVVVPHFKPRSEDDIQLGILNRYVSELREHEAENID